MTKFIFVQSDNYIGVATMEAYTELTMQMSGVDFGTHLTALAMPAHAAHYGYLEFDEEVMDLVVVEPEFKRAVNAKY